MTKSTEYGKPGTVDQFVAQAQIRKLKTAQLWALLRTELRYSNKIVWARKELKRRGYKI